MTLKRGIAWFVIISILFLLYYAMYQIGDWTLVITFTVIVLVISIVWGLLTWAVITLLS